MKHKLSFLMLAVALLVPMVAKAQTWTLENYGFTTGVDSSKWVDMSSATQILTPSASDGLASSVLNIGFTFPFGSSTYTQYSVNTDGNLRLGSTVTGTSNYTTPFSSTYANQNHPKINAFGCDGYGLAGSHYVKAKQHVTATDDTMLVVEFCMGTYTSATREFLYKWQIHLYTNGNIDIVFPSAAGIPSTAPAVAHQCGMCVSSSDGWVISSANNTAQHFTNGSSVTNSANTWFDANRYYSFIHPSNISCQVPTGLTASNITASSMTLSWTRGGTETQWELQVGEDFYYPTDTTYTVTSLDGNTLYTVGVRAICGAGDTSFANSNSFRTACTAISTLPFTDDFENCPYYLSGVWSYAEALPYCWHRINDATSTYNYYPYISTTSTYLIHGGKSMYWYHATSTTYANNQYAILPPIDPTAIDITDLTLAYYGKTTATAAPYPQFITGVMTDPTDATTFVPVDTVTLTTTPTLYTVSFANYTGTGTYIAIWSPRTSAARYASLDDIYLTDEWCDAPSALVATPSTNDITISWNGNGGSSFTVFLGEDTVTGVNDTSYTFMGLPANTEYVYGVATECASSISLFVGGTTRTLCVPIDSLPYTEDFDAYGNGSAYPISPCWHKGIVNSGSSTQTTNYPYPTSSTTVNGTRCLYFYTAHTSAYHYYNWAVLPPIDASSLDITNLELGFLMRRNGSTSTTSTTYSSRLIIGVTTDFTSTTGFVPVDTIDLSAEPANSVHEVEVSFANYTGSGTYIMFYAPAPANTTSSNYNSFHIDNVVLRTASNCHKPLSLVVESVSDVDAQVTWTPDPRTTSPSNWVVEYGPTGFVRDSGTTMYVSDTTLLLTGLTYNTGYDVYVYADCGGEESEARMASFRTLCVPFDTLPYTENFDGVAGSASTTPTENYLPSCWNYLNHGTRTSYMYCPYVYNSATYSHSGSNSVRFYSYNSSADSNQYLVLPIFDTALHPVNTLQVSFWMRGYSTSASYHAEVVVGVMTNPADESTFIPCTTFISTSTAYAYYEHNLGAYTGPQGCIALKFPKPATSGNYEYGYIDDVTVSEIPSCPPVISHNVTATAGAARITWNISSGYPVGPDNYVVSYGYAADSLVGATVVTTADQELVITGLVPDTAYMVSIQPVCTGIGSEAHTFVFSTMQLPCAEWDTTGFGGPTDTLTVGNPGTSTTAYMPVNNGYNYSYTQHLILSSHISVTGPTNFSGIAFDYAYSSPMTHATNCQIYMGNTTRSTFTVTSPADSAFVPYSQLQLVYSGPLNCTVNGYNYFNFNQGTFAYDGTSNIVVAIVNNSGSYDGTSYVFRYETASSSNPALTHRVYNNTTPYGAAEMDAARAYQSYWRTNMKLLTGGGDCIAQASCLAPAVTVETDSVGDVVVSWLPGYQEASWDLDYKTDTGSWVNVLTGTTLNDYTFLLSDLQPNTQYHFRVTANCIDTTLSATGSYTTPCSYISIPYTYGFEDLPTGSTTVVPSIPCWHHLNNGTSYPGYPYVYASAAHTGVRGLYWYLTTTTGTYGDYEILVLPPVSPATNPINTLQLSFWAKPTSASYAPVFLVGVMSDPQNPASFQQVATVNVNHTTTDWAFYEVPLNSFTGSGQYVAIRANRPSSAWFAYFDDVSLETLPPCTRVYNVEVSNITQHSATISWDTTSANDYEVQYGPTGFAFGAGTSVMVSGADSVNLTGLPASTAYDVYVRGICGTDTSTWSFVENFHTSCDVITVLPYTENFDGIAGSTATSPVPEGFLPPCWDIYNDGTRTNYQYAPYVYNSTTYAHSGANCIRFYTYNSSGDSNQYLILPEVDSSIYPDNTLQVSFWLRGYSTSTSYFANVVVGVMTDPAVESTFIPYDTINYASTDYANFDVNFNRYTGPHGRVTLLFPKPLSSSQYEYGFVDDVVLGLIPTCPHVSGMTVDMTTYDSVAISWTPGGNETQWLVSSDGTTWATSNDSSYIFTGLTASTQYTFYVRPLCGTSDTGTSQSVTARTTCAAAVLPYSQNFDGLTTSTTAATGVQAPCWDAILTGTASYTTGSYVPQVYYSATNAHSGNYSYRLYGMGYHMLPLMPTSLDSLQLTFWDYTTSTSYGLEVGVMEGSTFVPVQTITSATSTHVPHTVYFSTYTGTSRIIAFRNWYTTSTSTYYSYHYLDDIVVDYVPTCAPVTALSVDSATSSSITIDWADVTPAIQYQIEYGPAGFIPGTGSIRTATTHPTTTTGLNHSTAYDFYVRPVCTVGDTGAWTGPLTASTECLPTSLPYVQNFDNMTGTTYSAAGELPACWDGYTNGTSAIYSPHVVASGSYWYADSANSLIMTSGSESYGNTKIVRLPNFDQPVNTLTLSFWMSTESNTNGYLCVGYMTGPNYLTDFVTVDSIHASSTTYHGSSSGVSALGIRDTVSFADAPASAQYLAFKWVYTTSFYSCCIDDVEVTSTGTSCAAPVIAGVTNDYANANITVTGSGNSFELSYGTDPAALGNTMINSTGVFFLTGLTPDQQYFFEVVQNCDSGLVSNPVSGTFTTDELPCFTPDSVEVVAQSFSTATLHWISAGSATQWVIEVNGAGVQRFDTVGTNPYTIPNLYADQDYTASVRAICLTGVVESDWSDTIAFHTDACLPVSGVTVNNVTASSATASWQPTNGALGYRVSYGEYDFIEAQALRVEVDANTTSYTFTGLEAETRYEFYVQTKCGEGLFSSITQGDRIDFMTEASQGIYDVESGTLTLFPNPASTNVTLTVSGIDGEVTVEIVDLNGKRISELRTQNSELQIDLSQFAQGAYFVRVTGEHQTAVRKLIVR